MLQWILSKLKKFAFLKTSLRKWKGKSHNERIYLLNMSGPGLVYRIFKELIPFSNNTNYPI